MSKDPSKLIIFLLFLLFTFMCIQHVYATTFVAYVNGADTDDLGATHQQIKLKSSLIGSGVSGDVSFPNIVIGQPSTQSFLITPCQSSIAELAFPDKSKLPGTNQYMQYYENLGKLYRDRSAVCLNDNFIFKNQLILRTENLAKDIKSLLSNGNKLVIIPYSQGNFYVEAALGLLYVNGDLKDFSSIRVVNMGNPAPTSLNGFNVTSTRDSVANSFVNFPALYEPCLDDCTEPASYLQMKVHDPIGHFFDLTYMDTSVKTYQTKTAFPSVIASLVKRAISELNQKCNTDCITYNGNSYPAYYSNFLKIDRYGNVLDNNSKKENGWSCTYSNISNIIFNYRPELINIDGGWPNIASEAIEDVENNILNMNNSSFCGKKSWRLPTSGEFLSNINYFDIAKDGINLSIPKDDIPLIGTVGWLYVSDKPATYECSSNSSVWHVTLSLQFKCNTSGIYFGVPVSN